MELIYYYVISLLSFFGVFAGMALSYIAPEELRSGKRYFSYVRDILLIAIACILAAEIFSIYIALISLILIIPLILRFRIHAKYNQISYFLLAILLVASYRYNFAEISSLVFFYGAMICAMDISQYEKNQKIARKFSFIAAQMLKKYSIFLLIVILLSSIYYFI